MLYPSGMDTYLILIRIHHLAVRLFDPPAVPSLHRNVYYDTPLSHGDTHVYWRVRNTPLQPWIYHIS